MKKKKKIAFIDNSDHGGWAHHTIFLANATNNRRDATAVLIANKQSPEVKHWITAKCCTGDIIENVKREKPDVVNFVLSISPITLLRLALLKKRMKFKLVYTLFITSYTCTATVLLIIDFIHEVTVDISYIYLQNVNALTF